MYNRVATFRRESIFAEGMAAGTNPTKAPSYFYIQGISDNAAGLTDSYPSTGGRNCSLYWPTNLASGDWSVVPSHGRCPGRWRHQYANKRRCVHQHRPVLWRRREPAVMNVHVSCDP